MQHDKFLLVWTFYGYRSVVYHKATITFLSLAMQNRESRQMECRMAMLDTGMTKCLIFVEMSYLQTSPGFVCCILIALHKFLDTEEPAHRLLVRDIDLGILYLV